MGTVSGKWGRKMGTVYISAVRAALLREKCILSPFMDTVPFKVWRDVGRRMHFLDRSSVQLGCRNAAPSPPRHSRLSAPCDPAWQPAAADFLRRGRRRALPAIAP